MTIYGKSVGWFAYAETKNFPRVKFEVNMKYFS